MKRTEKEIQKRGQLTKRVKEKTKELFGYEFNVTELRLLPYIQYVMMNEQKLDINKISQEERKILRKWKIKGYITGGASGLAITKNFWNKMNTVLLLAYVDIN